MAFKVESRNWVEYRELPNLMEVDLHFGDGRFSGAAYWENMENIWKCALNVLVNAQKEGKEYVLFTHGWSTSHQGKTTSRSQIRKLMRGKEATPYIIRNKCIQHSSVFVAAIKPLPPQVA